MHELRLGINIDHIATIRNARGGAHPDPIRAIEIVKAAGGDGITAHLREDRRHIRDEDMYAIIKASDLPLNFEMAATEEMLQISLKIKPNACCIVPEKRTEVTTEGGLNVVGNDKLKPYIAKLKDAGIRVSLFVDAEEKQIIAASEIGADIVELHTGSYCHAYHAILKSSALSHIDSECSRTLEYAPRSSSRAPSGTIENDMVLNELQKIINSAKLCGEVGLECHAGHGLCYETTPEIAKIPNIVELNIGHFLIGEAIFVGLHEAISKMRKIMDEARG